MAVILPGKNTGSLNCKLIDYLPFSPLTHDDVGGITDLIWRNVWKMSEA